MSENEEVNTSSTGAKKAGNDQRGSLVPPRQLLELAKHYGVGSKKYDDHNWAKGYKWSLSYDALMRHLLAFWDGEDIDAETGSKHIIAVAWHAFALSYFMDNFPQFDDRPPAGKPKINISPLIQPPGGGFLPTTTWNTLANDPFSEDQALKGG